MGLNNRQWALYNYLKEKGNEWTTQMNIAFHLKEYYGLFEVDNFNDSRARHKMTADIRAINNSPIIQKIIITCSNGVKIANEEEFSKFIGKEINSVVAKLNRAKIKASKGNKNGQMRIVFGNERDTIKSFIDSDKDFGQRLKNAREKLNLTQSDAVKLMWGIGEVQFDTPMLSKFENGFCLPNKRTLSKLAEIYGVTADYLLEGILSTEIVMAEFGDLQAVK